MEGCAAWINARNLINSGAAFDDIKDALSKLTMHEIESIYEDGQNLLHFAVSKNNLEVARFLFEKKCFLPPHESETVPYLHVACFYGFSDMVDLLCGWTKSWGTVTVFADDWRRFLEAHSVTGDGYEVFQAKMSENEGISACRVAALCKHGACLKRLLENYPQEVWLEHMAKLGEVDCLRFLLDTEKFQPESLSSGFRSSLRANSPQCLEILLEYIDKHNVYSTATNPFLLLYSATPSRSCSSGHPLVECTRLLIHHGWDVNVMEEQGTFPLYCLLRRIIDYNEARFCEGGPSQMKTLDDEFDCLCELLAAGANPNFDERCNSCDETPGWVVNSGRELNLSDCRAFSSAAEAVAALIHIAVNSDLMDFISQTASLLVKYGCHMKGQRSWLGRMAEMDQVAGLKLLLATMEFDLDALNYGFEKSLYHLSPHCLKHLLQYATEKNVTFRQKSPLHFMYLYTLTVDIYQDSTAKCTRVLIKHGWSVNEMHTPASYPLYTILRSVTALCNNYNVRKIRGRRLSKMYANLKILLTAGADPNHDESAVKLASSAGISMSAFEGRLIADTPFNPIEFKSYSSGADILIDLLCEGEIDFEVVCFMAKGIPLLVQYGCDISCVNGNKSILHIFFKKISPDLTYYEQYERYVSLMDTLQEYGKIVSSLMAGGADINARDCHSKLPLSYFSEKLPEYIYTFLPRDKLEEYPTELEPILRILDLMDFEEAQVIGMKFMEGIEDCRRHGVDGSVLEGMKEEVQSHLNVRSLYNACLIKVLHYCGKLAKAQALELPLIIKDNLNQLFSF